MSTADGVPIAVTADTDHGEFRVGELYAGRRWQHATVQCVIAVARHIILQGAGASDAGDDQALVYGDLEFL